MKAFFQSLILIIIFFNTVGSTQVCTKVIVYGKDYQTDPFAATYPANLDTVHETLKKTFTQYGYELVSDDLGARRMVTGWKPTETDSHYAPLFERRDYGISDGSYYQVIVDMTDLESSVKVVLSTKVKSVAGRLKSSGKVEKRILAQLKDYLRSPQIDMTNVGTKDK